MNPSEFSYEQIEMHCDTRGLVVEPVDKETLQHQGNSHLVVTMPGAIRGNHYHRIGTEVAVILGPALVRVRRDDQSEDILVPEEQAFRFVIPPGLPHAMQNNGTQPMIMIAFNTISHDPSNPDVVRDVLIES